MLEKLGQTNHQWIPVGVLGQNATQIGQGPGVKTAINAFCLINFHGDTCFIFEHRLCLPLRFDGFDRLLYRETDDTAGQTSERAEDENTLFLMLLYICLLGHH